MKPMSEIVATYQVRVTLRQRDDHDKTQWAGQPAPAPVNAELERLVRDALYLELPYFGENEISVRSERVDR